MKLEPSIFKYILKHTAKDQVFLVILTVISMPFVYISLEIPKLIINQAIGGVDIPDEILGFEMDQIRYLLLLCGIFLAVIVINGGFKYFINVYRGVLGERMLRRFRFELYSRILRFPLHHFKKTSSGEIIPMLTAETEPLGGFIGDAFALPAFQGGLFLTYLFFIFNQDLWLGLAAIALFPPQMWLIPKLQRKVNALMKRRVKTVRRLADRVGESITGITEIHSHDTSYFERAGVANKLGTIYGIRYEIYRRKFFIKFINNFLAQLTPFFFYSIGGYLVITGKLSIGALVAVLAAYKDITSPWKELLKYYQTKEDVRVKYAQIIEQFQPDRMLPPKLQEPSAKPDMALTGFLTATHLRYGEDEFVNTVDGASFKLDLAKHTCIVGLSSSGKDDISRLMARLIMPTGGRLTVNDHNFLDLPESVVGRRIAYIGSNTHIFSGSIEANLFYGLKHYPGAVKFDDEPYKAGRRKLEKEATAAGNISADVNADWLDYEAADVGDSTKLSHWALMCLRLVELEEDIFALGLHSQPGSLPDSSQDKSSPDDTLLGHSVHTNNHLHERILKARVALNQRLHDPEMAGLVEFFDRDVFNNNMSLAENILFGAPLKNEFALDQLSTNPLILELTKALNLEKDLLRMGGKVAEIMLDLFADVAPDSELFDQFSFISSEDLPTFNATLARGRSGDYNDEDKRLLLSLPFKLIPARHRLGLIDDEMSQKLVDLRLALRKRLGEENSCIDFFTDDKVNAAISIQDNILFGKVAYGQGHAQKRVVELLRQTVESIDMHTDVALAGFAYQVGTNGSRLSINQRQKLAIARGLIKRPDLLIINDATSSLDAGAENRLLTTIREHMHGLGLAWVLSRPALAETFDDVLVVESGKVIEQGDHNSLMLKNGAYCRLLDDAV